MKAFPLQTIELKLVQTAAAILTQTYAPAPASYYFSAKTQTLDGLDF